MQLGETAFSGGEQTVKPPEADTAISISDLVKHYGDIKAVDGLSFSVKTAEIFALLGPNGAGKTTTVEMMEGYRRPDSGQVRVLGLDPIRQGHSMKQRIGLMLQQTTIYSQIKVDEAVAMFASYYKNPRDPAELIDLVGLASHKGSYFSNLSGGQKQRLSLALALVGGPDLVFLDEPTAAMDPQARLQTWDIIRDLKAGGVTVLLTTHYMEEAQRLADRVAIIDHGKLLALGTPESLIGATSGEVITFTGPLGLKKESLETFLGAPVKEVRPGAYAVNSADPLSAAGRLNEWRQRENVEIADFRVTGATLEDIFLQLTGSKVRD